MKERVCDEKLIIISVAVRGINDHITNPISRKFNAVAATARGQTTP